MWRCSISLNLSSSAETMFMRFSNFDCILLKATIVSLCVDSFFNSVSSYCCYKSGYEGGFLLYVQLESNSRPLFVLWLYDVIMLDLLGFPNVSLNYPSKAFLNWLSVLVSYIAKKGKSSPVEQDWGVPFIYCCFYRRSSLCLLAMRCGVETCI